MATIKKVSKKQQESIASKIIEFQITNRQLPLSKDVYNGFVASLSKESNVSTAKIKKFLKPNVWIPTTK